MPHNAPAPGRRNVLKSGALLIACVVAGEAARLTPAAAHAAAATPRVLTAAEAVTLGHFAETLVPGACAAGVVEFVDSQLAADATESLLIARYFGVVPPFHDFYRGALAALDAAARAAHGQLFAALAPEPALALAGSLLAGPPPGWSGPPAPLFYLAARGDAVDVVYGTPAGFEALGIPYMEHILPPEALVSTRAPEEVDVVIVGAGAAGSVHAAVLAAAGRSVVVLEGGPPRKPGDLYSSQMWARRLKWTSPAAVNGGADPAGIAFNGGHGYGGAALHHYAVWPRFHAPDFGMASDHGRGLDWPLDYETLRPFYDRIQADVGVSGDAARETWRPPGAPYPLPPLPTFAQGETIARGFAARGLHTAPLPSAILTQEYKGRPPCIMDGWCDAGCPIGALANPLVTYIPRAVKAGAVFRSGAHVTRVVMDAAGGRAIGVEYADAGGALHVQRARAVIVAAFAIETPRILLNSAVDKHPCGLGNASGLLGAYLMSHPSIIVFGMFDADMQNYMGPTGGQLLNQDHFGKSATPGALGSRQWMIAQALKPNDLLGISMSRPDIVGPALAPFMHKAARGLGNMVALCEPLPDTANRVTLSAARDAHGMPLAEVTHRYGADGKTLIAAAAIEGAAIMTAAGAAETWRSPIGGQHLMGGCVMGSDAARSVTDAFGRVHGVPNLIVAGPSLFPTASAVNPTFTVHALALRSAELLARNWAQFA